MFVREKVPAVCVEEPVSSTCCSFWNSPTAEMSDGGFVLCHFSFFFFSYTTIQRWLFRHRTLLLLSWSSLLLYLLCNSFSRKPWWRRSAPQASCLPRRCVAEVRGCQLWCASALSLAASPHFLAVPLVCKLPALILSANMYKM